MLLWVMGMVQLQRNVFRVIPGLYGWVYNTLKLSPFAAEQSVMVMTEGSLSRRFEIEPMGRQFSIPIL